MSPSLTKQHEQRAATLKFTSQRIEHAASHGFQRIFRKLDSLSEAHFVSHGPITFILKVKRVSA